MDSTPPLPIAASIAGPKQGPSHYFRSQRAQHGRLGLRRASRNSNTADVQWIQLAFSLVARWKTRGVSSSKSGVNNIYLANADGSGQLERLTTSEYSQWVSSWAAGNNTIAYLENRSGNEQIWVLPMDGDRKPKLFIESQFHLYDPEFSPDGRWLAYVSTESGDFQIYVQSYPGPGEKHRISLASATQPIWTKNGREIVFRGNSQEFFAASITSFDPFRSETPRLIYKQQGNGFSSTTPVRGWDATPDGQRLLVTQDKESNDHPVTYLQIVLNWDQELQHRAPIK